MAHFLLYCFAGAGCTTTLCQGACCRSNARTCPRARNAAVARASAFPSHAVWPAAAGPRLGCAATATQQQQPASVPGAPSWCSHRAGIQAPDVDIRQHYLFFTRSSPPRAGCRPPCSGLAAPPPSRSPLSRYSSCPAPPWGTTAGSKTKKKKQRLRSRCLLAPPAAGGDGSTGGERAAGTAWERTGP